MISLSILHAFHGTQFQILVTRIDLQLLISEVNTMFEMYLGQSRENNWILFSMKHAVVLG